MGKWIMGNGEWRMDNSQLHYSWTSTPVTAPSYKLSAYTFTGQYSYMDDPSTSGVSEGFGLMFYNARWYDPSLGRFAQADTIVPKGVQGLDRYAYVNNSPINYTDPTGHDAWWCENAQCQADYYGNLQGTLTGGGGNSNNNNPFANSAGAGSGSNSNIEYPPISDLLPSGLDVCEFVFTGNEGLCYADYSLLYLPFSTNPNTANLVPNYGTFQIGFPAPVITQATYGIVNGTATITYSNSNVYIAVGLNAGKTFTDMLLGIPASGNASAGWIIQNNEPTPQETHDFLTGWAVNVSVGLGGGGGATWTSGGMAFEGGLYSPQAGVSATYTVLNINLANGTWDILP